MKYNTFLIKFGELTTKGRNKSQFINTLVSLVSNKVHKFENTKLKTASDRLFVDFDAKDGDALLSSLQEVFGIHAISLVKRSSLNMEEICNDVCTLLEGEDLSSFKVKARRRYKQFHLNSDQINREVATKIFHTFDDAKVEIRKPKLSIHIEIRENESYIYFKEVPGLKGLPLGVNGKTLALLSGGIDSPVAAIQGMKKGLKVNALTFTSAPYTSQKALDKVKDLGRVISKYNNDALKLFEIHFTDIQKYLLENAPERIFMTLQRRSMFRMAEKLATKLHHTSILTGESLGQVASQTIESMQSIHSAVDMLVLQPLLSYDKQEIVEIAQKVNTFEISIKPYEDSCTVFLPNNPTTKPNLVKVLEFESKIIEKLLIMEDEAIENLNVYKLTSEDSLTKTFQDLI